MKFDKELQAFIGSFPKLVEYVPITLRCFVFIVLIAFALSVIIAAINLGKGKVCKVLQIFTGIFISFERGTPLIVQVMLVYFGIPLIMKIGGVDTTSWNVEIFVVIAFSLNLSVYYAETLRSSYLSINKGQFEAALSIGMNDFQIFRRVTAPLTFRVALPTLASFSVDTLKSTSLAFCIGFIDVMGRGVMLSNYSYGQGQTGIFLAVALIFIVLCFVFDRIFKIWERKLYKDKQFV